ncbi:hypothetical protein [Flavihumibacter sp. ZG627]|uniref:hypothetical protein n=1 Tax=Flavihumibacter sp. ZG627 TaxID=1463156 RepID=UPI00057E4189|nr:hypothetical protein [Flavihumibacter sp. ZG627]KIC89993.1 hypothetical protein HY58_13365 [Flavihumibacter sp. ZG627]
MEQRIVNFLKEIKSLRIEEVGGFLDLHHYTKTTAVDSYIYWDELLEMMDSIYFDLENLSRLDFNRIKERIKELDRAFDYLANKNLMQFHNQPDMLPRHILQSEILSRFYCSNYNKNIGHSARFFKDLYQVVMTKQNAIRGLNAALNKIYIGTDAKGKESWTAYTWIMYTYYYQKARGKDLNDTHRIIIKELSGLSDQTISTQWNKFLENGDNVPDHTNQQRTYKEALECVISELSKEGANYALELAEQKLKTYKEAYSRL